MYVIDSGVFTVEQKRGKAKKRYNAVGVVSPTGYTQVMLFKLDSKDNISDLLITNKEFCEKEFNYISDSLGAKVIDELVIKSKKQMGIEVSYRDVKTNLMRKHKVSKEIIDHICDNHFLAGVKQIKEDLGLGLKEAKEIGDEIKSELGAAGLIKINNPLF